jgi:tRNA-dihydrouridine synthase
VLIIYFYFCSYTFEFDDRDSPLVLQLAGNSAEPIVKLCNEEMFAGKIVSLNINAGCPQRFAMEKGYGAAMFNEPDRLVQTVKEIGLCLHTWIELRLQQ